jgi:subtilase family serine protease
MKWGIRAVLVLLGVAALAPAATGAGLSPQVRLGGPPPGAQAPAIGGLSPGAVIHFSVALKPRTGLAAFVHEVSDPTSPNYHAYLTPAQFGQRFGATPDQVAAVEASLRAHGMQPGAVAANRLSIPVTADAATVQRAFAVSLRRVRLVSGRTAVVPNAAPAVDVPVAGDVQAVVGLSSVAAPRPLLARSVLRGQARGSRPHRTGHVATGGPQPCSAASSTGSSAGAYTADQMASSYRFPGLYGAGNLGQGETIAMYELEPNDPQDIAAYQSCYGTNAPVSYIPVDGGVGSGQGSGEAALDIEVAAGLAPRATILVYQGPNSSSGTPGSGPYDTFSKIVNDDRAQVISTSWGSCEPDNGTAAANSESTLFQQAAAEGQTILAAAGDAGSEDCFADTPPNPQLAVDDPGSQPYVTSVGGTTLSGLGPPPSQSVWNTGGSALAIANPSSGAGGGGVSQTWKMPAYQANAAGSLNVQQANSSGSVCNAPSGLCRQVPDVSADADPNTGYVIYWNGSGGDATSTQGWQVEAGTSAAAPLWAALVALVNGSSGCHGSPIGFANPTLYQAAGNNYGASFDDVTSGNNDYTGLNGGKYPAGPLYDMATGLGTPNAAGLAGSLCPAAFRVNNPGRQSSSLGQNVSLQLSVTGRGSGVVYGVSGLPPGLSVNSSTGRITGKPKKVGTFTVGVAAIAPDGAERGTAFVWQISGRPSLSGGSLSALGSSRPRLQLTVKAAGGAPGLKSVGLRAPGGLRFVLGRGQVNVRGARGRPVSRRLQLRGGRLVILLGKPQRQVKVQVSKGALSASRGLSSRARRHRAVSLVFKLTATDAQGLQTQLALRVKSRR